MNTNQRGSIKNDGGEFLDHVIRLLIKPPRQRVSNDIAVLEPYASKFAFLLFQVEKSHVYNNIIAQNIFHEFKKQNTAIYNVQDEQSKFYLILRGEISLQNIYGEVLEIKRAGECFGEISLNQQELLSQKAIVTSSEVQLAVLDRTRYKVVLAELKEAQISNDISFLSDMRLFRSYNKSLLRELYLRSLPLVELSLGDTVYQEGSPTGGFFLIKEGNFKSAKQFKQNPLSPKKKAASSTKTFGYQHNLDLVVLAKGDYFGEEEVIFRESARMTTVVCLSAKGVLLQVKKKDFIATLLEQETTRMFLLSNAISKREWKTQRYEELLKETEGKKEIATEVLPTILNTGTSAPKHRKIATCLSAETLRLKEAYADITESSALKELTTAGRERVSDIRRRLPRSQHSSVVVSPRSKGLVNLDVLRSIVETIKSIPRKLKKLKNSQSVGTQPTAALNPSEKLTLQTRNTTVHIKAEGISEFSPTHNKPPAYKKDMRVVHLLRNIVTPDQSGQISLNCKSNLLSSQKIIYPATNHNNTSIQSYFANLGGLPPTKEITPSRGLVKLPRSPRISLQRSFSRNDVKIARNLSIMKTILSPREKTSVHFNFLSNKKAINFEKLT